MKRIICTLIIWLSLLSAAEATDYYVAKTGGGSTCSQASPCLTIAAGIAKLSSGDALYIRTGTYGETIPAPAAGTSSAYTLISNYSGEVVTVQPPNGQGGIAQGFQYVTIHGLIFDGSNSPSSDFIDGVTIEVNYGGHHVIVEDFEIKNFPGNGMFVQSNDNIVRRGHIHDNATNTTAGPPHGIYVGSGPNLFEDLEIDHHGFYGIQGYPSPHDITIRRVKAHDNAYRGITAITPSGNNSAGIMINGSNSEVSNSISYANGTTGDQYYGSGIQVYGGCDNCRVYNNTVYGNLNAGIENAGSNVTIQNNISYNNGSADSYGTATNDHNLTTNPQFTDAGAGDFTLTANSINAINAGIDLGPSYNQDFVSQARGYGGAWDIGAYEYIGGGAPPSQPLILALGLDEGTGASTGDASGLNNTAYLQNGAAWDNNGKYGKAIAFNGSSSYLQISYNAALYPSQSITIEAWVKPAAVVSQYQAIIEADTYWVFGQSANAACQNLAYAGFSASTHFNICDDTAQSTNWRYLAMTYDGTTQRYYRDGVPINSVVVNENMATSIRDIYIGASGVGDYFNGLIDEVRIWSVARTQAEIQSDLNTPISGQAPIPPKGIKVSSANSIKGSATVTFRVEGSQ